MMLWFDRLYPPLMLLFPALISLFARSNSTSSPKPDRTRRLTRALWAATLVALAIHVGTQAVYEVAGYPGAAVHRIWVILFPMSGFFVLWFGVAARMLAARDPGWLNTNDSARTTRSASLVPRNLENPSPKALLVVGWLLYVAGLGAGAYATSVSTQALIVLPGLLMWPGFVWGVRAMHNEGEPRDAAGSPELAVQYAALRRWKASGFLVCGMAGSMVFAATGLLVALRPESAGYLGGLGGAAVGVLGGAFGTVASIRRARILSRLAELEEAGSSRAAPA